MSDHSDTPPALVDTDKFAERIAGQIAAENLLITHRTGWNLTLQGLLLAALGLSKKVEGSSTIPSVTDVAKLAIAVSALTLASILAAYLQKLHLTRLWSKQVPTLEAIHPRPFGKTPVHLLGSVAPFGIPLVLMYFWYHQL